MALTLLESAQNSEDTVRRGLIRLITERNPILQRVPWKTITGSAYTYRQEVALPGIAFRGIGDSWPASTHSTTKKTEQLVIMGGEVEIDRFLLSTQGNKGDLKAEAYAAKGKALEIAFSEAFFEGDSTVNNKQFDGIRTRITGSQLLEAGTNGAVLTLDMLDQLGDMISGGGSPEFYINKTLRRKITSLGRNTAGHALIDTGTDVFGKQVKRYNGIPLNIIERDDNESTFLAFDETQGSSNVTASIYLIKFGEDDVFGIQGKGGSLDVKDFGELESKPQHMGRIEWYPGLVVLRPRSAVRLKGILAS